MDIMSDEISKCLLQCFDAYVNIVGANEKKGKFKQGEMLFQYGCTPNCDATTWASGQDLIGRWPEYYGSTQSSIATTMSDVDHSSWHKVYAFMNLF